MELGLTAREVERRLESGRLRRVRRGIYLLGPIVSPHTLKMAAVLACAPRAALSHGSASYVWGLLPHPARPGSIHVTVAGHNPGRHPGVHVHRTTSLRRDELTSKYAIPITTPTRTLLDVASQLRPRELEQALAEAFAQRLTDRVRTLSMIERHPGRPGVRALRFQLEAGHAPARTRSHAEERLLALIRDGRFPHPDVNVRVGRWEIDFLWREQGVAVEVDGYAAHSSPRAFRRDYAKTAALEAAGLAVIRVSWTQIRNEPEATLARIARAL